MIEKCICPSCAGKLDLSDGHVQCKACEKTYPVVQGIPDFLSQSRLSPEKMDTLAKLYDQEAVKYKGSARSCGYATDASYLPRLNIFKSWVDFSKTKSKSILDIGCGTGLMTRQLAKENEVWGVDISGGLLQVAAGEGLKPVRSSADALPFKDDDFDLVVCMGVLPYYADPEKILAQICRVVKPGGKMIVTSTTNSYLIQSVRFLKNTLGKKSQLERLYTADDISVGLTSQGAKVVDASLGYGENMVSVAKKSAPLNYRFMARVAAVLAIWT
ncbi:MAG: methyltransferase domain-containing protein [Desulfobacteraceae bacterium]|nr:methyltransferase domain-containing protein [Desulfobacteraceae bacterium]